MCTSRSITTELPSKYDFPRRMLVGRKQKTKNRIYCSNIFRLCANEKINMYTESKGGNSQEDTTSCEALYYRTYYIVHISISQRLNFFFFFRRFLVLRIYFLLKVTYIDSVSSYIYCSNILFYATSAAKLSFPYLRK